MKKALDYVSDYQLKSACKDAIGPGPDLAGGRPGAPVGRPGPSGVFGISERDWLSNYRVLIIEGFGGRPAVGGRPGARGPQAPPYIRPCISLCIAPSKVTQMILLF